jgi:hypothetical protein
MILRLVNQNRTAKINILVPKIYFRWIVEMMVMALGETC